jgi:hypothetical protein
MEWEQCLMILEEYDVGPNMRQLICRFWGEVMNVCPALENYGTPFKAATV